MNAVPAQELFNDVAARLGWDAADLDTRQWTDLRDALSAELSSVWEDTDCWWPELLRTLHLALREEWSSARIALVGPYEPGDVVFWPDSGLYYMAISTVSGEPPAYWDATSETWIETPTRWKELAASYEATEYEPGGSYPDTDYTVNSVFMFDDRYWLPTVGLVDSGIGNYSPGRYPSMWIELPRWVTTLPQVGFGRPPIGTIRRICRRDPRAYGDPGEYDWEAQEGDTLVFDYEGPRCWVQYRLVTPRLAGNPFSATTVYAATAADQQIYETELTAPDETGDGEEGPTEQVATPVISPTSGTFSTEQIVTITSATPGASIRYTLDGSTPTSTTGTLYAGQFTVTATTVITARAFKADMIDSNPATVTLTRAFALYWGTSTSTTLDAAGLLALESSVERDTPAGDYAFAAPGTPEKYFYLAWPNDLAEQPVAGTGLMSGPFIVPLAETAEGYANEENGWFYALVNVSGSSYRLYRTYYTQSGAASITVNTTA